MSSLDQKVTDDNYSCLLKRNEQESTIIMKRSNSSAKNAKRHIFQKQWKFSRKWTWKCFSTPEDADYVVK
jgi:hypothetical protein